MKILKTKKKKVRLLKENEIHTTIEEFLFSFNKNMPSGFPKATKAQLLQFKKTHASAFKGTDTWSLDQHRKKVIDWLPQNIKVL